MLNKEQLHNYQRAAVKFMVNRDRCALFLEMGLGKTISTLTAIEELINEDLSVERVLIIAPKRVAENVWTDEVQKWAHVRGLKVLPIKGTPKKREAILKQKADIYTIGLGNLLWLIGLYGGLMLPFDMVVIDESSAFKNHNSKRFKAFRRVAPSIPRMALLTGTPSPNGLIDLWGQIFLLDQGERLGFYITNFRKNFFDEAVKVGNITYKYEIKDKMEQQIYDAVGDICMSMKADDYLELPERTDNFIEVKFSKELQKQYKEFEKEKVLELIAHLEEVAREKAIEKARLMGLPWDGSTEHPKTVITAANSAGLMNKLMQFANGAVYDEDKNAHVVHDLKLEALEEIFEAAQGRPILVARSFKSDRDRILEKFGKRGARELSTDQDIRDWNDGKIPMMLMHPASGGHGLNLQAGGSIIVWYGPTWSLELYQQFNARLHRQGQRHGVVVHHIVAMSTVEKKVIRSIDSKEESQEGLMQAVKAYIDQYGDFVDAEVVEEVQPWDDLM